MRLIRLFNSYRSYRQVIFAAAGILFVLAGTLLTLKFARGYRFRLFKSGPTLTGTGLLVANSDPRGAQVFVNGKLTTATDDTLNLPPGNYEVEIKKDGFIPWKKQLQIKAELVTQTTTKLFPSVPNLTPLTYTGAGDPMPSPDGQKLVYKVDSASIEALNGLWVIELSDRGLSFARAGEPRQIARNTPKYNFKSARLTWASDSNQILAYWTEIKLSKKIKTELVGSAVLLNINELNDEAKIKDSSSRLPVLLAQWHQLLDAKDRERLILLPKSMQAVATASAEAVFFSPDELKMLFTASADLTIPERLVPDIPSESTQPESRDIKVGKIYVYDIKEDRNYAVFDSNPKAKSSLSSGGGSEDPAYWTARLAAGNVLEPISLTEKKPQEPLPPVPAELMIKGLESLQDRYSPIWTQPWQWFPTSNHLLWIDGSEIKIKESDGTNSDTVYTGPFASNFVYPWPNGSRLVILTSLNTGSPANLYSINLK